VIGGQFVHVLSTDRNLTDTLITADLLGRGKNKISFSKNGQYFITLAPIKDFNGEPIGVLVYSYDAAKAYATLASLKHGILLLCLALCAGILIPLFLVVRTVTKSINGTAAMLKEIAQGKGDLTKRLPEGRKDELGDLARYFNEFLDQIQSIVRQVIDNAKAMNGASNNLTTLAAQMSETADETSSRSAMVATATEEMSSNFNNVAAAMEESSTNLSMVADSSEAMVSTISALASQADEARTIAVQAVDRAGEATTEINTNISQASQGIQEVNVNINQSSEVIGEVSRDISVVNESAANITRSSSDVKSNAEKLNEMAGQLNTIVGSFKV
jgi:methyl-accepting chemotaxis protein